jgi:hypothetical protein
MATSKRHSGFKRLIDRNPTLAILVNGAECLTFRADSTGSYGGLQLGVPTYTAAGCADGAGISLATGYDASSSNRFSAFEVVADTGSTDLTGDTYEAAIHGKLNIGTAQSNASLMTGLFSMDVADEADWSGGNYFALRGHMDFWDDCDTSGAVHAGALSAYLEHESTTTIGTGTWVSGLDIYQVGAPTNNGSNPAIHIRTSTGTWQYGIYMDASDVAQAIYCSAAMAATGRIAQFYGTVSAGNFGDGYGAVEIDLTAAGTTAGHIAALSSWVNLNTGTTGAGNIITPLTVGIYEASAVTPTDSQLIFGMRMSAVMGDTTGWDTLCPFSLNTGNQAITALFSIASAPAIGFVAGSPSASAMGTIPIFCDADGTDVRYLHVYDSTS